MFAIISFRYGLANNGMCGKHHIPSKGPESEEADSNNEPTQARQRVGSPHESAFILSMARSEIRGPQLMFHFMPRRVGVIVS